MSMAKYPLFLILLVAAGCSSTPQWQGDQERTVEMSSQVHSGSLTDEEASQSLIDILSDYSHGSNESESLASFVKNVSNLDDFTISPVTSEIGWSGNSAYFVRDTSEEVKFILKRFNQPPKKLFAEIFGIEYLQNIDGLFSPKFHAVGKYHHQDTCEILILETPAFGRSFQFYFNQVGKFPIGTEEHQRAFELLVQGCRKAGSALAQLHSHGGQETIAFPEEMGSRLQESFKNCSRNWEIPFENLQKSIAQCIERMHSEPHRSGVTHGDVKLIHLFYEPDSEKISLIDPYLLGNSLKPNGTPQGIPSSDFYQFSRSLLLNRFGYILDSEQKIQKLELLTLQEAEQAMDAFREGYIEGGGIPPTPNEEDFFLLSHNLLFLKNADRTLPEPDATRLRDLVSISVADLKNRLGEQMNSENALKEENQ